jgi:hypothetical protein
MVVSLHRKEARTVGEQEWDETGEEAVAFIAVLELQPNEVIHRHQEKNEEGNERNRQD